MMIHCYVAYSFWFWVYLIMIVGPEVVLVGLWPWKGTIKSQSGVARIRLRHRFLFPFDILWHFVTFWHWDLTSWWFTLWFYRWEPLTYPKPFSENPKLEKPLQKEQILVPLVEKLPSCSNNDSSHVKFTLLSRDMHLRINMFINQKLVKYLPEVVYPNSYPKNNS